MVDRVTKYRVDSTRGLVCTSREIVGNTCMLRGVSRLVNLGLSVGSIKFVRRG